MENLNARFDSVRTASSDAKRMYVENQRYLETEELTGARWTDGKPIYRKVVDLGALPDTTTKNVAHGVVGIETLLPMLGTASNGAGVFLTLPAVNTASTPPQISVVLNGANLDIVAGSDRSGFTGFIILEYTKTG